MRIGALAKKTGVGIEAIRFYEREGLIKPVRRTDSNYREYDEDSVKRLLFIKKSKELGFSLSETKDLLCLKVKTKAKCVSVKRKAEKKLFEVEKKIKDLEKIRTALESLVVTCNEERPTSECPILETLETG